MKLKKLAAGVLAAVVAVTSAIVPVSVNAAAEDVTVTVHTDGDWLSTVLFTDAAVDVTVNEQSVTGSYWVQVDRQTDSADNDYTAAFGNSSETGYTQSFTFTTEADSVNATFIVYSNAAAKNLGYTVTFDTTEAVDGKLVVGLTANGDPAEEKTNDWWYETPFTYTVLNAADAPEATGVEVTVNTDGDWLSTALFTDAAVDVTVNEQSVTGSYWVQVDRQTDSADNDYTAAFGSSSETGYTQSFTFTTEADSVKTTFIVYSNAAAKNLGYTVTFDTTEAVDGKLVVGLTANGDPAEEKTNDWWYETPVSYVVLNAPVVYATEITLSDTTLELAKDDTSILTATVGPEDATDKTVTWSSSDSDVVSINTDGSLTAVGNGTATITANANGADPNGAPVSASCEITVTSPVTGITFEQETMELIKGDVAGIAFNVAPENANNKTITWSSDDTSVATVDESGNVTAVASGTATITATTEDGGFTDTCTVIVTNPILNIDFTQRSLGIVVGETAKLTVITTPTDCDPFEITWSTDNESIATVDKDGVITAVAEGSCVIKATVTDEIFIECVVTVTADMVAAEGVELNETEYTFTTVGDTVALVVSVLPTDATNQDVTWESSNTDVATVENGVVTAVGEGTAVITVTTEDGGFTATCNITVDVPETDETVDVPETDETVDIPETDETVDVPETDETVDVPETDETVDVPETDETVDVPETDETLDEGAYGDGEYAQLPESEIPEMIYGPVDISDQFISTKAATSATYFDGKLYIYSQYEESKLAEHDKAHIVVKHSGGKALKITTSCAYTRLMEGVDAADGCLYIAFVISNVSDNANDPLYYGNFTWTDIVME